MQGKSAVADDALAVAWRAPDALDDPAYPLCAEVDKVVAMAAQLRSAGG